MLTPELKATATKTLIENLEQVCVCYDNIKDEVKNMLCDELELDEATSNELYEYLMESKWRVEVTRVD